MYSYRTSQVCARQINIDVDNGIVKHVDFVGGCDGNLKAIGKLIAGKPSTEVISILEGNTCGSKSTSCADQLAKALIAAQEA